MLQCPQLCVFSFTLVIGSLGSGVILLRNPQQHPSPLCDACPLCNGGVSASVVFLPHPAVPSTPFVSFQCGGIGLGSGVILLRNPQLHPSPFSDAHHFCCGGVSAFVAFLATFCSALDSICVVFVLWEQF